MFQFGAYTKEDFKQSNRVFKDNMESIIRVKSKYEFLEHLRYYRVVTYYNAVDTIGWKIYQKLKEEQKLTLLTVAA